MKPARFYNAYPLLLLLSLSATCAEPVGTLVIVGGGRTPADAKAEFFKLAGGKERSRIVVLSTAGTAADDPKQDDSFLKSWRDLGPQSVKLLHTRDPKTANDPSFVAPLLEATAVWIDGGDQKKLAAAYHGTLLEKELQNLLKRGGVIGGTSAGAAIMSELMIEGGNPVAQTGPGFGLLNGIVLDQHFVARNRIGRLRGVLAKYKDQAGLGIDESTAVIIHGQTLTVKGASTVTAIWPGSSSQPAQEKVLKAGDTLDLNTFRVDALKKE